MIRSFAIPMNIVTRIPKTAGLTTAQVNRGVLRRIIGAGYRICLLMVVCVYVGGSSFADELILDESNSGIFKRGDFDCQQCKEPVDLGLLLPNIGTADDNANEISAGDLYRFFKDQGIESMDHLVLCLDIKPSAGNKSDVGFDNVVLTIEDPFNSNNVTTSFSLGDNTLKVPAYETSRLKPEARLEIALGYDFMKRFSENSKEMLKLKYRINGEDKSDLSVVIPIEKPGVWFTGPRLMIVIGFTSFWVLLFWILFKFTNPKTATAKKPNRRAVTV